jgi:hypothetical protein
MSGAEEGARSAPSNPFIQVLDDMEEAARERLLGEHGAYCLFCEADLRRDPFHLIGIDPCPRCGYVPD